MPSENKVGKLSDITKIINDGDKVAIGGSWLGGHPMAIIREIIRSKIKNLTAITVVGSIDVDLLIGAGCLKKLMFSFVSMEAFGLAPNFRRAIGKLNTSVSVAPRRGSVAQPVGSDVPCGAASPVAPVPETPTQDERELAVIQQGAQRHGR